VHPHLVVEHDARGYRRLLLARPQRRNALDPGLARALLAALGSEQETPLVLDSTDPTVFCAGADLTVPDAARAEVSSLLYECLEIMITRRGPVIAVVRGAAVGGGAQLAAAADLRIAGPGARLRWIGPPGADLAVGAWLLPELVGRGVAMELAMTARWVHAAEALAIGLVNRVEGDPQRVAAEFAAGFAARGPGSLAAIKQVAAAGGLLDRLRAEQRANESAWARLLAPGAG
jgi:enoyl-CoA hydratase